MTCRQQRAETKRKPTIYEALKAKLGREPTNSEIVAEVRRIILEGSADAAMR